MKTLIYGSVGTAVASFMVFVFMLWSGFDATAIKLLITLAVISFVQFIIYLVKHDMKEESSLITIAIGTGLASALVLIYMIWSGANSNSIKLLITLGIASIIEFVVYLIRHDIKEESDGQRNGTIAN